MTVSFFINLLISQELMLAIFWISVTRGLLFFISILRTLLQLNLVGSCFLIGFTRGPTIFAFAFATWNIIFIKFKLKARILGFQFVDFLLELHHFPHDSFYLWVFIVLPRLDDDHIILVCDFLFNCLFEHLCHWCELSI